MSRQWYNHDRTILVPQGHFHLLNSFKMCKPCASKARAAAAANAASASASTSSTGVPKVQMSSSSIATPKAKAFREVGRPRIVSSGIKKR